MDTIDKRILFLLLRDGRISQRRMAKLLNLTPPSLNYRFKKLFDDGILKGFKLFVNPNFYAEIQIFVAYKNYKDIDEEWITFKLRCLEWINVYGIKGRSLTEIKERIMKMSKELGDPVMVYRPLQAILKPSNIDSNIIKILREDPRISVSEIAKRLRLSPRTVERHIKYLRHKELILIIPEINLPKSDIILFSIFTSKFDEVFKVLENCKIWQFSDGYAGIIVCFGEDMEFVKRTLSVVRSVDRNSDIMIIYDYFFK
jgi:DNA-binding Lrp family transcriptional regulator